MADNATIEAEAPATDAVDTADVAVDEAPSGDGFADAAEVQPAGRRLDGSVFDDAAPIIGDEPASDEPDEAPEAEGEPVEEAEDPDEQEAPDPEESAEEEPEEPGAEANWETRAKYHQSRADRIQSELDTLKAQKEDVEALAPLLDIMKTDPAVLDYIEQKYAKGNAEAHLNGSGDPADTPNLSPGGRGERKAPQDSQAPPERPVRPEKPAEYDEFEAQNDPESASWQYRRALEDYSVAAAEYPLKVAEWQEEQMAAKQRQEQQRQQQEQAQQRYIQSVQEKVVQEFGGQPEDASGFVRWASKLEPGSDSYLQALYSAYRVREGGRKGGSAPRKTPTNGSARKTPPPPAASGGSAARAAQPKPKVIEDIWGPPPS